MYKNCEYCNLYEHLSKHVQLLVIADLCTRIVNTVIYMNILANMFKHVQLLVIAEPCTRIVNTVTHMNILASMFIHLLTVIPCMRIVHVLSLFIK